jgi:hypothetical protein
MPRMPASTNRAGYALKACGLIAVAVVSGLLWYLIRHDSGPALPPPGTKAKEFSFAVAEGPVVSSDCAANATGEVKKWLAAHPCQRLVRALYNTAYGNDQVLVSVAVVTAGDPAQAGQLKALADRDGTGNVTDLLEDGTARIPNAVQKLADGTYAARVAGDRVTIVLSEFYDGHSDDAVLTKVSGEALDLGDQLG